MVRENPAYIQPLMQQLATTNPQLAQLINQNPEALLHLLGADEEEDDEGEYGQWGGGQGQHVIQLTEQEAEAVRRVSGARGFRTKNLTNLLTGVNPDICFVLVGSSWVPS